MVKVISQKILISLLTLFFYSFVFAQENSNSIPNGSTSSISTVNPDEPTVDPSESIEENQTQPLVEPPSGGAIVEPNGYEIVPPGSEFPNPDSEFFEEDEKSFREDQIDSLPEDGGISPEMEEIYPAYPEDDFPVCLPYDSECILDQNTEEFEYLQ